MNESIVNKMEIRTVGENEPEMLFGNKRIGEER